MLRSIQYEDKSSEIEVSFKLIERWNCRGQRDISGNMNCDGVA